MAMRASMPPWDSRPAMAGGSNRLMDGRGAGPALREAAVLELRGEQPFQSILAGLVDGGVLELERAVRFHEEAQRGLGGSVVEAGMVAALVVALSVAIARDV